MRKPNANAPLRISKQQLAKFGLELVTRDPLVVRCAMCGGVFTVLSQSPTHTGLTRCAPRAAQQH